MALLPIEREDWPGPPEPAAAYPELCGWPCCSFLALYQIILHYITSYFISLHYILLVKKTSPISLILLFPGSAPTCLDAKNSSKWATFFLPLPLKDQFSVHYFPLFIHLLSAKSSGSMTCFSISLLLIVVFLFKFFMATDFQS